MRRQLLVRPSLGEAQLEALVRRTLAREARAWDALWCAVDPAIDEIAGRWRLSAQPCHREDDRRNVVLQVMDRFQANGFRRLGLLHEVLLRGDGSYRAWISTVTLHATISYVRGLPENLGGREAGGPRLWAAMVPLPDELSERLPESARMVDLVEARRIQAYAQGHLAAPQLKGLHLWLTGQDNAAIAVELALADADEADRLVRAALKRLRVWFCNERWSGEAQK